MNSPNRLVYALFDLSLVMTKSASAQVAERKVLTFEGSKESHRCRRSVCQQNHAAGGVITVMDDGGNLCLIAPRRYFSRRRKYFDREGPDGGHVPPNKLSGFAAWQRKAFQPTSVKEVEFRSLEPAPV